MDEAISLARASVKEHNIPWRGVEIYVRSGRTNRPLGGPGNSPRSKIV
jgi:hypothetical protein